MTIDEAVTIQHHASTLATDAAQMVGKLICGRDAGFDRYAVAKMAGIAKLYRQQFEEAYVTMGLSCFESVIDIAGNETAVNIYYEVCDGDVILYHAFSGKTDITALVCGDAWADYKEQILESFRQENISNAG